MRTDPWCGLLRKRNTQAIDRASSESFGKTLRIQRYAAMQWACSYPLPY
jgi:hypothetical protein